MINLIIEAGRNVQIAEQRFTFFYRNARTYASRTSWHLSVVRFVRTLTYVDQVELWYFKLQDLSVILHHLCFYLCTKLPMASSNELYDCNVFVFDI